MVEEYYRVSLDFDGVLAQGHELKIRYAYEWFGVRLGPHQTKKTGFERLMRELGRDITYRDLMDPLNERHIMEYSVPDGCVPVLSRMQDYCRFFIITSRDGHDFYYAKLFAERHFCNLIEGFFNTDNAPKDSIIESVGIRAHVDDDLTKLASLPGSVSPIFFRQPENFHLPSEGFLEAYSFYDVESIINDLRI